MNTVALDEHAQARFISAFEAFLSKIDQDIHRCEHGYIAVTCGHCERRERREVTT